MISHLQLHLILTIVLCHTRSSYRMSFKIQGPFAYAGCKGRTTGSYKGAIGKVSTWLQKPETREDVMTFTVDIAESVFPDVQKNIMYSRALSQLVALGNTNRSYNAKVNDDEAAAIAAYTFPSLPLYRYINGAMRDKDAQLLATLCPLINLILRGMSKLPPFSFSTDRAAAVDMNAAVGDGTDSVVYRGMLAHEKQFKGYKALWEARALWQENAFLSTTGKEAVARNYVEGINETHSALDAVRHQVLFVMTLPGGKTRGRYIGRYSETKNEFEVLFPPGTVFQPTQYEFDADSKTHVFRCEEVPPEEVDDEKVSCKSCAGRLFSLLSRSS
eukprot:TRINITY_DN12352_c0_g1_i1.p1 TRINITY_DN12352_c0_g1~~TRINITY_DN12352_c0_g1_i1.p1  ORF type:complete len:330 (+),score=27.52 TRINITY_DN12352_c0_g1_i1:74-1063(+)